MTTADLDQALEVVYNAGAAPPVCNALDTLLVQAPIAPTFVPRVVERLSEASVRFKVDEDASEFLDGQPNVEPAGPGDWDVEWLDLILGIRVVPDLDTAISHIYEHSTDHSDGILSSDPAAIERFLNEVDSAVVYANASTRFTDGGQLGPARDRGQHTEAARTRPDGADGADQLRIVEGDGHVARSQRDRAARGRLARRAALDTT